MLTLFDKGTVHYLSEHSTKARINCHLQKENPANYAKTLYITFVSIPLKPELIAIYRKRNQQITA